eukprot:NODE_578_length_5822_cov_0.814957.p5 type:complete len:128 gc:universal NODE_578_length_5822_cov_0.814957:3893-4276(+)
MNTHIRQLWEDRTIKYLNDFRVLYNKFFITPGERTFRISKSFNFKPTWAHNLPLDDEMLKGRGFSSEYFIKGLTLTICREFREVVAVCHFQIFRLLRYIWQFKCIFSGDFFRLKFLDVEFFSVFIEL